VVARTVASSAGPLTIYVIGSVTAAHRAERYLRNTMLVGFPFLAALAGWLVYWVMGQALAPVNAMRIEVDRIEAADLSGRVRAGSSDDEITRLGSTLNRMLDRLEEASTRQQLFAASASHELRSPLSAIRTELEVGLTYPDRADWPRIADDSLTELARLETLARDLRTLTRSTSKNQAIRQRVDLAALVTAEVTRRHPARNVRYQLDSVDAVVDAESDSVVQVVRNLFDNAERHAATEVTVTITCDTSGTRMVVANDGPPIPLAERDEIFEPFTRLDNARTLDGGGSGLGLAIARSIMRGFGGSLHVIDVDRGAAFEASFPRSTQSE
jgi:signal transduction histidine kinase